MQKWSAQSPSYICGAIQLFDIGLSETGIVNICTTSFIDDCADTSLMFKGNVMQACYLGYN